VKKSKLKLDKNSDVLEGFDWGITKGWFREELVKEFTEYKGGQYQVDFKVDKGDIVFDFGASIGPFVWQIKDQEPSKVICIEPSESMIGALVRNCQSTNLDCEVFKCGIGSISGEENLLAFGADGEATNITLPTLTFMDIVKNANVDKIDFLKTDCEGGEYSIKEQFKIFRETYLRLFPKFKIYSIDMFDITDNLWRDMFLDYYNQVIIYIDNR